MDNSKSTVSPDKNKREQKNGRNKNLQKALLLITTVVLIGFLIYILILLFGASINSLIRKYQDFVLPMTAMMGALITSMVLTSFLKNSSKSKKKTNSPSFSHEFLFFSFGFSSLIKHALRFYVEKILGVEITKDDSVPVNSDRDDTKKSIKNKLMAGLVIEASAELKKDISRFSSDKYLEDLHSETKERLLSEIESQTTKGIFSLSLGVVTASIGMVILAVSAFGQNDAKNYVEYILHYLPRLSIALVIEIFAYFFLKLYKKSLDEIKYFQNELTNIEMKFLGLMTIKRTSSEHDLKELASELMKTERNYILEKGQTTIFLERDRMNLQQQKELGSIFSNFIKTSADVLKK